MKIPGTLLRFLACLVIAITHPTRGVAADFSAIWDGSDGNWDDPLHWNTNPNYPNNAGVITYDARINSGTVALDRDITIQRLFFNGNVSGGKITGGSQLTLNDGFTWTGGEIALGAGGIINLPAGSTSSVTLSFGSYNQFTSGTINNGGTFTVNPASAFFGTNGVINNQAGGNWIMQNNSEIGNFGVFNNAGTFTVQSTGSAPFLNCPFNNSGTVTLQSASGFNFALYRGGSASGTFNVQTGFGLVFGAISGPTSYTLTSGAAIMGGGRTTVHGVTLNVAGAATIDTDLVISNSIGTGFLNVQSGATLTLTRAFTSSGTTSLFGGIITSVQPLNFQSGKLTGAGIINANVNNSGTISPGNSAGSLTINGQLSLLDGARLVMEIGGVTQATEYDYLSVNGAAGLDGTLELRMLNNFQMQLDPSQIFTLLTSNSLLNGLFDNVANGARLTTSDGLASFQVNYGAGSPYGANNLVLSDPRAVPEPTSLVLFAGGLGLLGYVCERGPNFCNGCSLFAPQSGQPSRNDLPNRRILFRRAV